MMLNSCHGYSKALAILLFLLLAFLITNITQAATYNLSSGSYPVCNSGGSWSVSGSTYTCSTKVVLGTSDIVTANSSVTIYANDGFSLASNTTVGSASNNINLTSNYGTITSGGTTTIYGVVNAGVGAVTLTNATISGALTSNANINLTGGSISGLVTSSSNTITTNGTSLLGGATAQSGMSITGGTLTGNFTMTANNPLTLSGVTMTSGNISGASTVTIQNGSVLGSASSAVAISSNNGAISVNNSTVYGSLTAPNYSTVNVTNGAQVYGVCSPGSTPANACNSTMSNVCPSGVSSGITGNYYNNTTLTEPSAATRSDGPINFNWGAGAPGPTGIGADTFSVRWTGYVRATTSGIHRFRTVSDDGVRLYVNGTLVINRWNDHSSATDTSPDISLVAGQSYSLVLEYYENAGSAVIQLSWQTPGSGSYVAIPAGPTPTLGAGLYECTAITKPPVSSCSTNLTAGITGKYFNNMSASGTVVATRLDGPINFDWGTGVPGPAGVNGDNFSVSWDGYIRVSQSGIYRFQTNSDDGVRLTVNGDLLIDQWNDHSVTTHTSVTVNLSAGNSYPIKMEYYENGGYAVAQLLWQTPTGGSYVAIPRGSTPSSSAGLYECTTYPAYYQITNSATGVTCAAESVKITAFNASGIEITPSAGTVVNLGTNPATGVWVGGNTYTFSGSETNFTKYLQQTTPSTLNITAASTTAGITATGSSSITFNNAGLKIAYNFSSTPPSSIPVQIAGVSGTAIVKAIRTDNNTGACVARIGVGTRSVGMAYSCNNPSSCVNGQNFSVKANSATTYTNISANNNNATSLAYTNVSLNFNANGEAPIDFVYSDVGQLTLYSQLTLDGGTSNDPSITLSGSSDPFIVKPYALRVTGAAQAASPFLANPGTTSSGNGFIAAGEKFNVTVRSYNAVGAVTPNFGNESISERNKIQLRIGCPEKITERVKTDTCSVAKPEHPLGGTAGTLIVGEDANGDSIIDPFVATSGGGILPAIWKEVGSIRLEPGLSAGYLGQGASGEIERISPSGIIGRFFPDHFILKDSLVNNSCQTFTYMDHPTRLAYTIEARTVVDANGVGGLTTNYIPAYGTMPTLTYVAEDGNSGVNLGNRINDGITKSWTNGSMLVNSLNTRFMRLTAAPFIDGPYPGTQLGIILTDNFDSRVLKNLDMNASMVAVCSGTACTAKALGSPINVRYGRLRLDDAFGPETANLPVNFYTEYWIGNRFVKNTNDTCTTILRSAISYPNGNILSDSNRTVQLTSGAVAGSTTGNYETMDATQISFTAGDAKQFFSAPTSGATGTFPVNVDLTSYPWLRFDWNQDGNYSDTSLPTARFGFGSYRGHDRVIYWRERFQ
ncbi:MAG TPA: DUF6701 domain-containing protein [Cellvibrio sp.]